MPVVTNTPTDANNSIAQTNHMPSPAAAEMMRDLETKPENSGNAMEAAPMMQKPAVIGMDL